MTLPNIIKSFERVPAEIVARAAKFQPAILSDVGGRRGALHGRIRALRPTMKVAGPAFTVEVRPGDNLMIHAALALAQPGDVAARVERGAQRLERARPRVLRVVVQQHRAAAPHKLARDRAAAAPARPGPRLARRVGAL